MQPILLVLSSGALVLTIHKIVRYWQNLKSINNLAGPRRALSMSTMVGNMLPAIPGIAPGSNHLFKDKFKRYEYYRWDAYAEVSWITNSPGITIALADATAIKEVTSFRARFPKPIEFYGVLAIFGDNIVTTEGDLWRKYKKLTAPAFSDKNNVLVWTETVRIIADLFEDVWADQKTIEIDHCLDLTLPIALYVLGAAVFGNRLSWNEEGARGPGHELTFKEALHNSSKNLILKAAIPSWAFGLTPRLRQTRLAFEELGVYMHEMLQERITSPNDDHHDLFSILLASANSGELKDERLDDIEVLGNIFIFLVAGHETTAHTLCFTFALLALYQEEQEKLYQQIRSVLPNDRLPKYEDMPLFTRSMAVFYETLRMFPPVTAIPKLSAEDTTLDISNQLGEKMTIPIPKGTNIIIDTAGLHYNPRYWPDPHSFKPDRFMGDYPRDAFLPFSAGARACLGRKFFETEGIAVLTMIMSKYKVSVKEEPQFAGETFEQKRERVLANMDGVTLTPIRVPVVFTRRG